MTLNDVALQRVWSSKETQLSKGYIKTNDILASAAKSDVNIVMFDSLEDKEAVTMLSPVLDPSRTFYVLNKVDLLHEQGLGDLDDRFVSFLQGIGAGACISSDQICTISCNDTRSFSKFIEKFSIYCGARFVSSHASFMNIKTSQLF